MYAKVVPSPKGSLEMGTTSLAVVDVVVALANRLEPSLASVPAAEALTEMAPTRRLALHVHWKVTVAAPARSAEAGVGAEMTLPLVTFNVTGARPLTVLPPVFLTVSE